MCHNRICKRRGDSSIPLQWVRFSDRECEAFLEENVLKMRKLGDNYTKFTQ